MKDKSFKLKLASIFSIFCTCIMYIIDKYRKILDQYNFFLYLLNNNNNRYHTPIRKVKIIYEKIQAKLVGI